MKFTLGCSRGTIGMFVAFVAIYWGVALTAASDFVLVISELLELEGSPA